MSVPLARWWARGWLAGLPVTEDLVDSTLYVLTELVSNAVRQGDGPVRITLELGEDTLRVEVFDVGHRMPRLSDFGPECTGGRGLQLVEALADDWGVRTEDDGKAVWALLAL